MRTAKTDRLIAAGTVAAVLAAWWLLTATEVIPPTRFASPHEFWAALKQVGSSGYADARLHEHVLHSAKLVLMGFAVAIATGVPLGLAMGWSRRTEALVNPAFLLVRPIPPLAWIPLAIVWLGLGDAAKVLVIWFAAFVPSVINSYVGVRSLERHVIEAARMLGISRTMMLREVLIPGAAPHIFTGLRLSLQACWTTLVAGELIGAAAGLGRVLAQGALDIFPAMILVGMVFVAISGGVMTWALGRIELLAMPWRR
ncbi:MAG: ABC transporter permease [Burkholderiales bacterium]